MTSAVRLFGRGRIRILLWLVPWLWLASLKQQRREVQSAVQDRSKKIEHPTSLWIAGTSEERHGKHLDIHNGGERRPGSSPYAYVFMAFGCDPDDHRIEHLNRTHEPGYRAYVANMLAATEILRRHGSQADVVAMFKMKTTSKHHRLPQIEEDMLKTMGINIRYIPKNSMGKSWEKEERKHFFVATLNKIEILNLTEYRRVLFLDSDVLPLTNLDYMFELSDGGPFEETVVLATARVPMIAGFFVTTPNAELYHKLRSIAQNKVENNLVTRQNFDIVHGWGHVMQNTTNDRWLANRDNGTLWDYHGANADQGIFYYYPKYIQSSMTQILSRKVLHFRGLAPDGTSLVEEELVETFSDSPIVQFKRRYSKYQKSSYTFEVPNCRRWMYEEGYHTWVGCLPPYSDHAHFTHPVAKPWQQTLPKDLSLSYTNPPSAGYLWWQTLLRLEQTYPGMNISILLPTLL